MDEIIKTRIESVAEDFDLELTNRQLNKFSKLVEELKDEDIAKEEILEEFILISPDEEDETWNEFFDELTEYVIELQNENESEFSDEYE